MPYKIGSFVLKNIRGATALMVPWQSIDYYRLDSEPWYWTPKQLYGPLKIRFINPASISRFNALAQSVPGQCYRTDWEFEADALVDINPMPSYTTDLQATGTLTVSVSCSAL